MSIEPPGSQQCGDTISVLGGRVVVDCDFIARHSYLQPHDAAIVGGSLIEGIGNINSDIDVYVLTHRLRRGSEIDLRRHFRVFGADRTILTGCGPDADVYLIHALIPGERIKIDIEFRTWEELDELSNRVDDLFQKACRSLISLTASVIERRSLAFIHRLHHSMTLRESSSLSRLRARMSVEKFKYIMYRWKGSDYSVFLDIQGAWRDRDWVRCADMARENMVTQFHAYTHLCGNTHYHRKWITTYARSLNVNRALYNNFLKLLLGGAGSTEDALRCFVLSTFDFVDDVFSACSEILEKEPLYPSGAAALSLIQGFLRAEDGEYSENEIAYCKKAYGLRTCPTKDML